MGRICSTFWSDGCKLFKAFSFCFFFFLLFLQFHWLLYRYVQQEQGQPHIYFISWTVTWTLANDQGRHFYNCDYGVCIQGGDDTIVVWDPSHFHGTSLQDYPPTSQTISEFNQIGLAIVSPSHFPQLWEKSRYHYNNLGMHCNQMMDMSKFVLLVIQYILWK